MTPKTSFGRALAAINRAVEVLEPHKPLTMDDQIEAWACVRNAQTFLRCVDVRDFDKWESEECCDECASPADVLDDDGRPLCARHLTMYELAKRKLEVE